MTPKAQHLGHRIGNLPLYPFLIGSLPAIHFYETNFRLLQGHHLLRPILLSFLLAGLLLAAGRLVWRSTATAALVISPLLAVLFKGNDLGMAISIIMVLLTLGLGAFLRLRPATWPLKLSGPLNAALIILTVLPLVNATMASRKENAPRPSDFFQSEITLPAVAKQSVQPDIYYLLVDGLGQATYLEENYPLTKARYSDVLAKRGFKVLRYSFANYPQTALSTAATMNMGTMDQLLSIPDPQSKDRRVLMEVVGNSRVARAFKKLGYKIVGFPSGYPLTHQALADKRHAPFLNPSFVEYYLLEDSALPLVLPLLGHGPADVSFALRRDRLNFIFDQLPAARDGVDDQDPVFVYAHILAPHPPFVFGPEGEALPSRGTFGFADGDHWLLIHGPQDTSYRQRYSDQATYVMQRLGETIDGIIASSERPKIIIVQGDHGPGSGLDWERPQNTDHTERLGIFNAWYVSGSQQMPVYEGMTAINTFPLLFNTVFGTELEAHPDKLWFARMSQPYTFFRLDK
jgi:hypothetical protein